MSEAATAGRVLLLNGANLNLLGRREPEIYGATTLADIEAAAHATAARHGLTVDFRQSNSEGDLVDWIHEAMDSFDAVVINPAGFTHTSVVIRDALSALSVPVLEVHMTNVHKREEFRHHSYVSAVATAMIVGAGAHGYTLALQHVAHLLNGAAA
jgi:3-dehydroquinate dehydratase-2